MNISLDDLAIRPPTLADAERTLALIIRSDIAEYGEADSDMEDLIHDWGQIDLEQDAWLALTPGDDLAGYAAVLPWGRDVRYMFYSAPDWEGVDLGRVLLACCEERGPGFSRSRGNDAGVTARTFIAHVNERDRQIVEAAGFQPGRYYFQMHIDLNAMPPEPVWPEEVSVRSFVVGQDERATYELIQDAFDQPGRPRSSYEDWSAFMLRSDIFDPGLWFLAVAGKKMVGASLCFAYPSVGWVRQLGVDERWRHKGIGAALLRHSFLAFRELGYEKVGLSVESKRPDAFVFYQRVGMKQARQYDEYLKAVL